MGWKAAGSTVLLVFLLSIAIFAGSGLRRLEAASSGPAASIWPMFHGVASHTGYAGVVGPQTATLKWKVFTGKTPAASNSPPTSIAISPQGAVYVGGSQAIFALDVNGKILWYKNFTGVQGPAIASDGTIYFVSGHSIVAVDSQGNQKWQYTTGNSTIFGPVIGPDGTTYQGSWDHYFYAINPDGTLKWRYLTAGAVSYSASIGTDGTVYLGGGDAHAGGDPNLYAFDSSGNLKWKYNTGALRVGTPAITSSGTIYVAASGVLDALNSAAQLQWSVGAPPAPPSQQPVGIITPAIGSDGTIYAGNSAGLVSAINPNTQVTKWTYQTGPDPSKSPAFYGTPSFPIVDSQGDTYFGAADYKMYAFDSQGRALWSYTTGGEIAEAAPAIDSNGNLYFSSDDGYTYAIAGPQQPTATSSTTSSSSVSTTSSTTASVNPAATVTSTVTLTLTTTVTSTVTNTATLTITSMPPAVTNTIVGPTSTTTSTIVSKVTETITTSSGGGGIPEFPYSVLSTAILTFLVVASYLVLRRQKPSRGQIRGLSSDE